MDEINSLPTAEPKPVTVCDIHFRTGSKTYYFDPNGIAVKPGDHVIIETARGPEFGYCAAGPHNVPERNVVAPLRKVLRIANERDEYVNADNRRIEKTAYATCQEKIEQLGLEMQLVSCENAFDGSKLMFYFTADGRVDFRELVKQLASAFRTRVELRQIGVRDKAKMVGGLGICGRPFCCGQFLSEFAPVSIKMAKTQNLSLNPTKISGTCGRLMCCLKYEQEAYEDLLRTSPKAESFVDTPEGRGTVTDVNLMGQSVKVRLERDPEEIRSFRNEEIAVFRNGKPKKTDAPIPQDWAPISGSKPAAPPAEEYPRFERSAPRAAAAEVAAKPRRTRPEKTPAEPEPALAPAPVEAEAPVSEAAGKSNKRRRRGGKNRAAQTPVPAAADSPAKNRTAAADAPAKKPAPAAEAPVKKLAPKLAPKKHPAAESKKAPEQKKSPAPELKKAPEQKKSPATETPDAPNPAKKKPHRYYHRGKKK